MKNLDKMKIKDRTIKNEKEREALIYVRALIRNAELEKILKKRMFKDAQNELMNAHIGIDVMTCDEKTIYQVLKRKAENYIEDRKQVIMLKKECQVLPSSNDIEALSLTDQIHLTLIAHTLCKTINLSEHLLEIAKIPLPLYEWPEKFRANSNGKKIINSCCYKMLKNEGNLFYGIKIRKGCLKEENIKYLLFLLKFEKNRNKHYQILTDYFCELLYNSDSEYEVIREETAKQIMDIGIHDFVVKCNVFQCMHRAHAISDITGIIHVKLENEREELIKVSAGYCKECNIFFILNSTYQHLVSRGNVLCRVMDERSYLNKNCLYGNKLARESLLMQYGYNVAQVNDLSDKRRHDILSFIIDNGILVKSEIISYLNFFISQSNSRNNMENAISKWKSDCVFVEEYELENYKKIEVKSIRRR